MLKASLRAQAVLNGARRAPAPALIFLAILGWVLFIGSGHGTHSSHAITPADPGILLAPSGHAGHASSISIAAILPGLGMWLAMLLAMSPPLLVREVGTQWRMSLRRNRLTRTLLFLYGYAFVWVIAGVVAVPLSSAIGQNVMFVVLTAIAVVVWQLSPLRRRALRQCHRTPMLRAFGVDAYRESLRYGLGSGAVCVAICGPAMLLVLLTGQFHVIAMALVTIFLTIERYRPLARRTAALPLRDRGRGPDPWTTHTRVE
ncbi:MAG: DUF2182 domain-containing protein [Gulosibacter sp.]|uniref:copper chaperone n=1 Tax=Gulosibacter sp. TaxID=2817531 RepID=UPI003F93102B